jgi:hypothetical protein
MLSFERNKWDNYFFVLIFFFGAITFGQYFPKYNATNALADIFLSWIVVRYIIK